MTSHHSLRVHAAAIIACLIACIAACGGGQPEPATPTAPAPSASAAPTPSASAPAAPAPSAAPGAKNWDAMSRDERLAVMKTQVMPKMSESFKAVDADHFKDFSCVTCHGKRIKEGNFDMPNPDLPKLNAKDSFKKHMDTKPAITKFMMTKVVPDMAAILGEAPFDPATHKGFGCANCHLFEK